MDPAGSESGLFVDCLDVSFVLGPTGRPSVGRCKAVVPCSALVGVLCVGVGAAWGGGKPWLGWAWRRAALRVRQAGLVFLAWAIEQPWLCSRHVGVVQVSVYCLHVCLVAADAACCLPCLACLFVLRACYVLGGLSVHGWWREMDVGVGPAVLVLLRGRMAGVYQPPPCNRIIIRKPPAAAAGVRTCDHRIATLVL
jgi:hypothetical protein